MFENYDLSKFGSKVQKVRVSLGLSREAVSKLSNLSISAIFRMENGISIPRYDTLLILSRVYKTDLIKLLEGSRKNNAIECLFDDLNNYLFKCDNVSFLKLKSKYIQLKEKGIGIDKIDLLEWEQLEKYLDGLEMYLSESNYKDKLKAIGIIEDAILLNTPNFSYENLKDCKFTPFEYRMLYSIASMKMQIYNYDNTLTMLNYLYESFDEIDVQLYKDTYLHTISLISYYYYLHDRPAETILFANKGIEFCLKYGSNSALPGLFFRKGVAYKEYSKEEAEICIRKAIYILFAVNNLDLAKDYYYASKLKHGFKLDGIDTYLDLLLTK